MKPYLIGTLLILASACSTPEQERGSHDPAMDDRQTAATVENYPESVQKILAAHGGLDQWRKMQSLSFEIVKEKGNEKHFVQLRDRRDRVEGPDFTMGFDGTEVWMEADTTYKGNPEFYHNLMFYFYAMPFVLADEGINYGNADALNFEGVTYPGVSISYNEGVGTSPKDQYFLYYHPETFQMAWLGYTVTYFSDKISKDIHWIRYSDWGNFNRIELPSTITWYKYEEGLPTEPRNSVEFINVKLDTKALPDGIFRSN